MSKTVLTEKKLKRELTPEQYERFCRLRDQSGLEDALLQLPNIGRRIVISTVLNGKIKKIREFYGLTQTDLANVLDVSQREYWRYEQDGYQVNSITLMQIALFYNVSLDWLFGLYDGDHAEKKLFSSECTVNGYCLSKILETKKQSKVKK